MELRCDTCGFSMRVPEPAADWLREKFDAWECPECATGSGFEDDPSVMADDADPYRRVRTSANGRKRPRVFRLRRTEPSSPLLGPIELPVSELGLAGAIAALFILLAWVLSLSSLAT